MTCWRFVYHEGMDDDIKFSKDEAGLVAKAAYCADGSFGTSPVAWNISNFVLDPRYHAAGIICGLILWIYSYILLGSSYPILVLSCIAYAMVFIGAIIIGRSVLRIKSLRGENIIKFKQFKLYFDKIQLLPEGLTVKYADIDHIKYSLRDSRLYSPTLPVGDFHEFIVSVKGVLHRCVWYGPSISETVFDYKLDKLLYYLGFREDGSGQFTYDSSVVPSSSADIVPSVPGVMSRALNSTTIIICFAVIGVVLYFLWSEVAVRVMQ